MTWPNRGVQCARLDTRPESLSNRTVFRMGYSSSKVSNAECVPCFFSAKWAPLFCGRQSRVFQIRILYFSGNSPYVSSKCLSFLLVILSSTLGSASGVATPAAALLLGGSGTLAGISCAGSSTTARFS